MVGADAVVTAGAVVGVIGMIGRSWVGFVTDDGIEKTGPTTELPQPARVTAAIAAQRVKPATRFRDPVLTNVIRGKGKP